MKVFYDQRQSVAYNDSFSPSAGKPEKALAAWQAIVPVEIMPVTPVTAEELQLVHDKQYVEDVLACKINNGFNNKLKTIADSLLWTNGSFVSAAFYAVKHKESVVSPTSGFHHAEYHQGMGFCTFNGLMLAAVLLKNKGLVNKVAIADIDMHYGNGTDHIIGVLDQQGVEPFVSHYTFGGHLDTCPIGNMKDFADKIMTMLPDRINQILEGADVLFYQAGADPHVDDPYGGALSTAQLKERDRIVFTAAKEHNVPVVWNLAGGYQPQISKVLEIHNNTALMHMEIFGEKNEE